MKRFEESLREITFLNKNAEKECKKTLDEKMKPIGGLGIIEKIAIKLAGILPYKIEMAKKKGCHIVASASNGVIEEGVSPCPEEYTKLVTESMVNDCAAISIFCNNLNVDLKVVDVGMKESLEMKYPNFYRAKIMEGTNNFKIRPAMTKNQAIETIENGIFMIEELEEEYDIFSTGEMGIGNTTTSAAIVYSLMKCNLESVVGMGSGLNEEGIERKKKVIFESCVKYNTFQMSPVEILNTVGGLDIAFLVGLYIGAAKCKKLILVDGFISATAALVACRLNPIIKNYLLFTHISEEPGMKLILEEIGEKPFLDMKMRMGEGTGAIFAYPMVWGAIDIYHKMKKPEEIYKMFC